MARITIDLDYAIAGPVIAHVARTPCAHSGAIQIADYVEWCTVCGAHRTVNHILTRSQGTTAWHPWIPCGREVQR